MKFAYIFIVSLFLINMVYGFSLTDRLEVLKNKGFFPRVIYDIGAYKGEWTMDVKKIFKSAEFILFEANEQHEFDLKKLGVPYFIKTLGNREDMVMFYSIGGTGDSVLREQTHHYQQGLCNEQMVKMSTLDNVVHTYNLPLPDFVKMDVQGAEKMIIEGGVAIIRNAEVIILEVGILQYNHGAPLIAEMINFMELLGYCVNDFVEFHYLPTRELIQVDILFIKNNSPLIRSGVLC